MPTSLTIVGLGPGSPAARTRAVQRALDGATTIILRTGVHPGLRDLLDDARVTTCDDLYESGNTFDEVYRGIADRVAAAARAGDVVYGVPGHPRCGEATVDAVLERLDRSEVVVAILDGISCIDSMATFLGQDLLRAEVQVVDALSLAAAIEADPFAGGMLELAPTRACLILQVYSQPIASATKLALLRLYPPEHQIALVSGAGGEEPTAAVWCPLHELDHQRVDHLSTVWVPACEGLSAYRSVAILQRVIARLRAPDGCPWDREQSHASLRSAIIEEAHEVVDAIDASDADALAEELGDLLFQPIMHAQIAEEAGAFDFEDVVEHATRKLVRRHPHVFADARATTPDDVIETWEAIKAQERQTKGIAPPALSESPFDKLPKSMPAATRVARLVASERNSATLAGNDERERLGDVAFEAISALARAGFDPEVEIARTARRRFSIHAEPSEADEVGEQFSRS